MHCPVLKIQALTNGEFTARNITIIHESKKQSLIVLIARNYAFNFAIDIIMRRGSLMRTLRLLFSKQINKENEIIGARQE